MPKKAMAHNVPATQSDSDVSSKIANAILDFIAQVPHSNEGQSSEPVESARRVAANSAIKAASAAGALALPPGPLGWITIIPEMVAVWRIQASMVSDIAAFYGKSGTVTQEQMLYCLFKHTASQAVRDLVVRVGERYLVKRASLRVLQKVAQRVGVKVTQRSISKAASRWLPVVGAVGVAAYAYYDTAQVAKAAIELFERDVEIEPPENAA